MDNIKNIEERVLSKQAGAWRANPDEGLIGAALPPPPPLPVEAFGHGADYLVRAGLGANVRPDYVAGMLLSAIGGLIGKQYQLRISSDWFVPLMIWAILVGDPSSGKTPACKAIRRRVRQLELAIGDTHRRLIEGDILEAEQREASREEIDILRAKLDTPPRHIVNDSTSEALARIETRSPRGLLVERDELAGLIEALERYSAGVDRAFYLEAFDIGAMSLDRVKAGNISILNHLFSICGGIQPERFRTLLTHSGDDDGMSARLLPFWPDPLPAGGIPNGADHSVMENALDRIHTLPGGEDGQPVTLNLEADAFTALDDWYKNTAGKRRGVSGKVGSAYGKLPGYAGRLAGLLHIIDWAFDPLSGGLPLTVPEKHVSGALVLIENYFVPQIKRAYHGADAAPADALAGELLTECQRRGLRTLNLRTARREWGIRGARSKDAAAGFKAAGDVLVETGWAKSITRQGGASDFEINPALFAEA